MNERENENNEHRLFSAIEELRSRIVGMTRSGMITKEYAQAHWKLVITIMRRAYIVGETAGIYALEGALECFKPAIREPLTLHYMNQLVSAIPVIEDAPLFTPEEERLLKLDMQVMQMPSGIEKKRGYKHEW